MEVDTATSPSSGENAQASSSAINTKQPQRQYPFPTRWEAIVSAPIEESDADIFLQTLSIALDAQFIPNPLHFRLLLFLALTEQSTQGPFALRIISQIISQCPPSALSPLIPSLPLKSGQNVNGFDGNSKLKRSVEGFMVQTEDNQGGIWGILGGWRGVKGRKRKAGEMEVEVKKEGRGAKRGKGRAGSEVKKDEEEEEEEEEKVEEEDVGMEVGVICENGWKVLGVLAGLWKRDMDIHTALNPDQPCSPLLIKQLPHEPGTHSTKQMDDLKLPLRVIKAGLYQADQAGITSSAGMRILNICKDLSSLLITPALPFGFKAKFHPPALLLSLISTFKPLPLHLLKLSLTLLSTSTTFYPHFLTIFIEDLAGVRAGKVSTRRDDHIILAKEFDVDWSGEISTGEDVTKPGNNYPPPRLSYLAEILLLSPQVGKGEMKDKMKWLKIQLARWCIVNYGDGGGSSWGFVSREGWEGEFRECMGGSTGGEEGWDAEEILGIMKDLAGVGVP